MRSFPLLLAALVAATSFAGCQDTDPKKPQTWIARLERKDVDEVKEAVRELRKMKASEAVDPLVALLGHEDGKVREEAAYALQEIGDKRAVDALVEAVDLSSRAKGAGQANARIATALGTLGDAKAVPALLKMLGSNDNYLRLAAVDALAELKDGKATPQLVRLVGDEQAPELLVKKAIIAVGNLRAEEAVAPLLKAMVTERRGISFYVEASYALFQIGAPAQKALIALISGEDKAYAKWAEEKNRVPAGYLSKAAVVLADFGDPAAIPALVRLLKWTSDDPGHELLVRGFAAEALGRLRAKEAAPAIAAMLGEPEANIRGKYAQALAFIGDKSVLPRLEAAAKNPKDSWGARQEALTAVALLGDARNKGVLEAAQKSETPDASVKHCLEEASAFGEPDALRKDRCEKQRVARPKYVEEELGRLMAGEECKTDVACWAGKLKDQNLRVRERAAFELGKSGDPKAVPALAEACREEELLVRRAAFIALDWLSRVPEAKGALKPLGQTLAAQFEEEKGRSHTIVVNEDLRRLAWKLQTL